MTAIDLEPPFAEAPDKVIGEIFEQVDPIFLGDGEPLREQVDALMKYFERAEENPGLISALAYSIEAGVHLRASDVAAVAIMDANYSRTMMDQPPLPPLSSFLQRALMAETLWRDITLQEKVTPADDNASHHQTELSRLKSHYDRLTKRVQPSPVAQRK